MATLYLAHDLKHDRQVALKVLKPDLAASLSHERFLKEITTTANLRGRTRVVFNICGNRYRLVVDMRYDLGRVYIRHVVTHQEYDRLIKRRLL